MEKCDFKKYFVICYMNKWKMLYWNSFVIKNIYIVNKGNLG